MNTKKLIDSGEHKNIWPTSLQWSIWLISMALLKKEGLVVLEDLAERMCISRAEYDSAIANLSQYIIEPSISSEKRLKRIFDMFRVVFADRTINDKERRFVYRYALRLGFSKRNVRIVVDRSIAMFTGNFDFDAYINFIKR